MAWDTPSSHFLGTRSPSGRKLLLLLYQDLFFENFLLSLLNSRIKPSFVGSFQTGRSPSEVGYLGSGGGSSQLHPGEGGAGPGSPVVLGQLSLHTTLHHTTPHDTTPHHTTPHLEGLGGKEDCPTMGLTAQTPQGGAKLTRVRTSGKVTIQKRAMYF